MSLDLAKAEEVSSTRILTLDSDRVNSNEGTWFTDVSKRNTENKIAIILGHNYKHLKLKDKS